MGKKLIHVGYTNGHQVKYAKEESGLFYPDTEGDCYIPLFMYECHLHRTAPNLETFDYVRQLEAAIRKYEESRTTKDQLALFELVKPHNVRKPCL